MVKAVLFVCVHNTGRSQMAEALLRKRAAELGIDVEAISAGVQAAGEMNPTAVQAMNEIGVDMGGQYPKMLTNGMSSRADRVVSMGCGVDASSCPARFLVTEDWGLDDPAGQPIEAVRLIRDQIADRVEALCRELISEN